MKYGQIEGHPAQMTMEQAAAYHKPVMVGFNGQVKMCVHDWEGNYYIWNYMEEEMGDFFCKFEQVEAIRGCTSFDF